MSKIKKEVLTPKWLKIKEMYEKGTNGSNKFGTNFPVDGELDTLCKEFTDLIGKYTEEFGFGCTIEDVKMPIWKERIWNVVENAGLLPEIAWRDKLEDELEIEDKWYKPEEEDEEL